MDMWWLASFIRDDDFESSSEFLLKAIAADPKSENARFHLSLHYQKSGKLLEAQLLLEEILRTNPRTRDKISRLARKRGVSMSAVVSDAFKE